MDSQNWGGRDWGDFSGGGGGSSGGGDDEVGERARVLLPGRETGREAFIKFVNS